MRLNNIQDLANYIAKDLRLHILTCVGIVILGIILIYLVFKLSNTKKDLVEAKNDIDIVVGVNEKLNEEVRGWRGLFGPFPSLYENSAESQAGCNHNDMTIAIDLDGVILTYVEPWFGVSHFGEPILDAAEAIGKLKSAGFTIVIYTTRNNSMAAHNKGHDAIQLTSMVQAELDKAKIPYDFISLFKPLARYYIDDRAIRFKNWGQALGAICQAEFNRSILKIDNMNSRLGYQTDASDPRHG